MTISAGSRSAWKELAPGSAKPSAATEPELRRRARGRARERASARGTAAIALATLALATSACAADAAPARQPRALHEEPRASSVTPPTPEPADPAPREGATSDAEPLAISIGGARIDVHFSGSSERERAAQRAWIERCARAVASYYGQFPVPRVDIWVRAVELGHIRGGQTFPTSPPTIRIVVGGQTSARDYAANWSMTHEMVHLALPNLPAAHAWLEEGLATYVEPIARARIGWIDEDAVWTEWIQNMPRGLPASDDGGLDGTERWGRLYWGGALFCLLADIEIRRQSDGRQGLEHALRAVVEAGGNVSRRWGIERTLELADRATSTTGLGDTYRSLGLRPVHVDLDGLWRDLGVRLEAGRVVYDEGAPLAAIRRAIVGAARP